jgi:hypothetical protein
MSHGLVEQSVDRRRFIAGGVVAGTGLCMSPAGAQPSTRPVPEAAHVFDIGADGWAILPEAPDNPGRHEVVFDRTGDYAGVSISSLGILHLGRREKADLDFEVSMSIAWYPPRNDEGLPASYVRFELGLFGDGPEVEYLIRSRTPTRATMAPGMAGPIIENLTLNFGKLHFPIPTKGYVWATVVPDAMPERPARADTG